MPVVRSCPYGGQRRIGPLEAMSMPKALLDSYLPEIASDKSEPSEPSIFLHFSGSVIQRSERNEGFDGFLC